MTSVIGIRMPIAGQEHIILGADTQITEYDGDVAVRKKTQNKIWYGKNWAIAYTGTVSNHLDNFRSLLEGRKSAREGWNEEKAAEMMTNAIRGKDKIFKEVGELARLSLREGNYYEDLNEFIFVTREPLALWYIDAVGNVYDYPELCKRIDEEQEDLEYMLAGTGKSEMRKYIQTRLEDEESKLYVPKIQTKYGPSIVTGILQHAKIDVGTNGPIGMVAVTPTGVYDYSKRLKECVRKAEKEEAEDIGIDLEELLTSKEQ